MHRIESIPISKPHLFGKEYIYVTDCINDSWLSSKGKYVEKFESEFSNYCNVEYGIAVSNGTVAIHLALRALDVQCDDEIIVTNFTTMATIFPIIYCNAKPVFIDSEKLTGNIDAKLIEKRISNKTKCILVVHLYGHPVDMDPIIAISKNNNLPIIEDAAEAHGAEYKGRRVGRFGVISCFSFYGNKIITTGEGGMVLTNDFKLANRIKMLRNLGYGQGVNRFSHLDIGYNYRMTNIQAAIGLAQCENIDKAIERRIDIARLYNALFNEHSIIKIPHEMVWAKNVYWMYTVWLDGFSKEKRNKVISSLLEKGIDTRPVFPPAHSQPVFSGAYESEEYLVSEELSKCGINLPTFYDLTGSQIEYIANQLKAIIKVIG